MGNKKVKTYQNASLVRRFIAYLIDWYICGLVTAFPIAIFSQKIFGNMKVQSLLKYDVKIGIIAGVLALITTTFYLVIVPKYIYSGQTIGKKLCKIKIIRQDGQAADLKTLLIRELVGAIVIEGSIYTGSTILHQVIYLTTGLDVIKPLLYGGMAVSITSAILVLITKNKFAIHDYIAGSWVVMAE